MNEQQNHSNTHECGENSIDIIWTEEDEDGNYAHFQVGSWEGRVPMWVANLMFYGVLVACAAVHFL